jgi:hypothetical protein
MISTPSLTEAANRPAAPILEFGMWTARTQAQVRRVRGIIATITIVGSAPETGNSDGF